LLVLTMVRWGEWLCHCRRSDSDRPTPRQELTEQLSYVF